MEEIQAREDLEQQFGKLPEPEQPAPPGVQAPAVVLQETPMEEEQMGGDSEAALPRDARGTTPTMDFARLQVLMQDRWEVTSPTPVITLPPVPEQVVPDEVEMAAEEAATEEPEKEWSVFGEVQAFFGKDEEDLDEVEQADLAEHTKRWQAEEDEEAQIEQDAQLQIQAAVGAHLGLF